MPNGIRASVSQAADPCKAQPAHFSLVACVRLPEPQPAHVHQDLQSQVRMKPEPLVRAHESRMIAK